MKKVAEATPNYLRELLTDSANLRDEEAAAKQKLFQLSQGMINGEWGLALQESRELAKRRKVLDIEIARVKKEMK